MRKTYRHLFFDLDRTLWDYDQNATEAFKEILDKYQLCSDIVNLEQFVSRFHHINEGLWLAYRKGEIDKKTLRNKRFEILLAEYQIFDNRLTDALSDDYIELAPTKTRVFPQTAETLDYLASRYQLHIITNGFKEVQHRKIANCGLAPYFSSVVTSDCVGLQKPHTGIFAYALTSVNARKSESLMTGDDLENDIIGAKKYGIDQVLFNPKHLTHASCPTYEIFALPELRVFL